MFLVLLRIEFKLNKFVLSVFFKLLGVYFMDDLTEFFFVIVFFVKEVIAIKIFEIIAQILKFLELWLWSFYHLCVLIGPDIVG